MSRFACMMLVLSVSALLGAPAFAEDDAERQHLFGEWNGERTELSEAGLEIESNLIVDATGIVAGGVERGALGIGNYDLIAEYDTSKAGLWEGGRFFGFILGVFGEDAAPSVGDLQNTDNIEAPNGVKLYELWYEQAFFDDRFGVLAGIHDFNSEFYSLNSAATLLNSSFGIGADLGLVPPSIFPNTTLAVRLRLEPTESAYLLAALYNGTPSESPHGAHFDIQRSDGAFYAVEGGVRDGDGMHQYKLGVGTWYRTTDFEDFAGRERGQNDGAYIVAEKGLYVECDPEQGLMGFVQFGSLPDHRNLVANYLGAGLAYTGLIDGRDHDVLAFGMARAFISEEYREITPDTKTAETAFELNYRAQLYPYLALTPDVQWVVHPGAADLNDALVLRLRLEVAM